MLHGCQERGDDRQHGGDTVRFRDRLSDCFLDYELPVCSSSQIHHAETDICEV